MRHHVIWRFNRVHINVRRRVRHQHLSSSARGTSTKRDPLCHSLHLSHFTIHLDEVPTGVSGYEMAGPVPRKASRGTGASHDPFVLTDDDDAAPSRRTKKHAPIDQSKTSLKRNVDMVEPPAKRSRRTEAVLAKHRGTSEKPQAAKAKKVKKADLPPEEVRSKRHRPQPTQDYLCKRERALTQPMFVLSRSQSTRASLSETHPQYPTETVDLAGTTGNVYTISISKTPSCTCPSGQKDGQCKHMIYVLARVLKARDDLVYQLALTENELRSIFATAPKPEMANESDQAKDEDGRKPLEGDCPICFCEFEDGEEVVWCRAACGNNVHQSCFAQWAKQRGGAGTCPFCRSRWVTAPAKIGAVDKSQGRVAQDGYVNVASQLGISGVRDTSTYHSFWVGRQRRGGNFFDEDRVAREDGDDDGARYEDFDPYF